MPDNTTGCFLPRDSDLGILTPNDALTMRTVTRFALYRKQSFWRRASGGDSNISILSETNHQDSRYLNRKCETSQLLVAFQRNLLNMTTPNLAIQSPGVIAPSSIHHN